MKPFIFLISILTMTLFSQAQTTIRERLQEIKTHTQSIIDSLDGAGAFSGGSSLALKVDKIAGYGLSQRNFSPNDSLKLVGIDTATNHLSPSDFYGQGTIADDYKIKNKADSTSTKDSLIAHNTRLIALNATATTNTANIASNTSNITANTTAIGLKADKSISVNTQTASYSALLSDAGGLVRMNVGSANNFTVPLNSTVAFPIGTQITVSQAGGGQTTIVATGGVTINSADAKLKLRVQYSGATLIKVATDTWSLYGDITL